LIRRRAPSRSIGRPLDQPEVPDAPAVDRQIEAPERDQDAALAESTRLANLGRLEEAERLCRESVERHGPSADAFYLLALIRDAAGDPLEAMGRYRKALYLDPHHENALAQLSLLLEALGRGDEARRLRDRARRAALRSGA
jgi:chemotaxis protein methyltransferase WspC